MFQEPTRLTPTPPEVPADLPPRRPAFSSGGLRAGIVLVACLVLVVPVLIAMGSTPGPATSAAGATATPTATAGVKSEPSKAPGFKGWSDGRMKGLQSGPGRGPITITAISGSNLSLATADGWKRTIGVTSDAKLTKGGQTITVGDLKVGDEVRFTQTRNDDGTYTITAIVVPTPKTTGEVSAVSGNKVTLKKRDGSTQVITVTSSTIYTLGKADGSRSDVKVGVDVTAEGTVDGSDFTALSVHVALAHASGEVTATTNSAITLKGRDGTTTVIHVSSSVRYRTRGKDAATIADIAVGDRVQVDGTRRSDGSLDAITVYGFGPKGTRDGQPKAAPTASAAPG
jgi:Domain of unknown function (DUF5666)